MLSSHRIIAAALVTAVLSVTGILLGTTAATAAPTKSQTLFRKALLEDAGTTKAVKRLLTDGGGFVAREIEFSDLTGDGRLDAVVLVESGGVAGAVGLYLFSTHGRPASSNLRAVYRSQRLYGASQRVSDATLIVQTPRFASGDDVCCPTKILERSYSWSDAIKTLVRRSMRELAGPD